MSLNYNESKKQTYEETYLEDVKLYNDINRRYGLLQENDIMGAYHLMKDSLQVYNRWSVIRKEYRELSSRGEKAPTKGRIEEMLIFLYEVHTDSRIIFTRAKRDFINNREID
jgi:hypothetical protein